MLPQNHNPATRGDQARGVSNDKININKLYPFAYLGSKARILDQIETLLPQHVKQGKSTRYVEPFLGGASVLLRMLYKTHVSRIYGFKEFYGFDNNVDMLVVYNTLIRHTHKLLDYMALIQQVFNGLPTHKREAYYYQLRAKVNSIERRHLQRSSVYDMPCHVKLSAMLVILINTAFARRFSYNRQGQINMPFNRVDFCQLGRPLNLPFNRLEFCAQLLAKSKIGYGDFSVAESLMSPATFCYLDPPYVKTNSKTTISTYSSKLFTLDDQKRLCDFMLHHGKTNRSLFMLSNTGFQEGAAVVRSIYSPFNFYDVAISRNIANAPGADMNNRMIPEYVITNYPVLRSKPLFS